jgi:hypothetical protein
MKIGDKIKYKGDDSGSFYEIIRFDEDGDAVYLDEEGDEICDYMDRFELCCPRNMDFNHALSLVGKNVYYKGKPFMVEAATVFNKYYPTDNKTITREVKEFGYSIVLENDDGFAPFSEIEEISNKVVLNDEYSAIIENDVVKVGCQTIPIDKVEEILKTHKKLKG